MNAIASGVHRNGLDFRTHRRRSSQPRLLVSAFRQSDSRALQRLSCPLRPSWRQHRIEERYLQPGVGQQQRLARDVTSRAGGLTLLAQDVLYFLGATVTIIPLFKSLKISPVLGFLASGFVLNQLGLTKDLEDLERLSELGVLFLLFEMGLELSLDRLKALAKYAFGLGTLQMVLCTAIFACAGLPVAGWTGGESLVTEFLEDVAKAPHSLVSIRSLDEAIVIGGALSLSSSAFVLQLLGERGELPTRFGSATLGILLLQDIAVVPFLVLLPLLEQGDMMQDASPVRLISMLLPTALQTVVGLGLLLVGGRVILRRIFEVVAQSRNTEAFLALCLLTVAGASYTTSSLGLSDTMGAFIAGVLLAETNYKTQVEADIKPFRGLLLGLFFTTTGGSIDSAVLLSKWQVIAWLLAGLLATKTAVIASLAKSFGLTSNESIRIGFMLSQGGEFAFVLLSLAAQLKVLPESLNQVLIIVVVLSMALTPGLAELGKVAGDWLTHLEVEQAGGSEESKAKALESMTEAHHAAYAQLERPIVICGFGPQSQLLANMLENPLVPNRPSYVVFDLDPLRVQSARQVGFPVIFGDGSRNSVLQAAGVKQPRAFVVCHRNKEQAVRVVDMVHSNYPNVPVYACGADVHHAAELEEAGALTTVVTTAEAGLSLGIRLLSEELGMTTTEIAYLKQGIDNAMAMRTATLSMQLAAGNEVPIPEIMVLDTVLHHSTGTLDETSGDDEDMAGNNCSPRKRNRDRSPERMSAGAVAIVEDGGSSGGSSSSSTSSSELANKSRDDMVVAATAFLYGSGSDDEEVATMVQSSAAFPGMSSRLSSAELPHDPNDSLSSIDDEELQEVLNSVKASKEQG